MAAEYPRGGEFTELVPNQVLSNEHWHPCLTVVDRNRISNHLRNDRGGAGIRLDHRFLTRSVGFCDPLVEFLLNKRTLLN